MFAFTVNFFVNSPLPNTLTPSFTSLIRAALTNAGLVKDVKNGVKVLGNGELTKKLTVKAKKFSESAKKAIEAAGGTVEVA